MLAICAIKIVSELDPNLFGVLEIIPPSDFPNPRNPLSPKGEDRGVHGNGAENTKAPSAHLPPI